MLRVPVKPALVSWARDRASYSLDELSGRFPNLQAWERGDILPTLKQLEAFAKATHVPFGYFFFSEPPVETVPIPDFRTRASISSRRPSPDLLDTLYRCQARQDWYQGFARSSDEPELEFVGSAQIDDDVVETAARMRHALGFELCERRRWVGWTHALRRLMQNAEKLGILAMVSASVPSNNRRRLDVQEFRGFAIADPWAPLVFVNAADTRTAQMFMLAYEFAHIWSGTSALSDADVTCVPDRPAERWCHCVAMEFLLPIHALRDAFDRGTSLESELERLARRFKVSALVVLRRLRDANQLSQEQFQTACNSELRRLHATPKRGSGASYLSQAERVSKRFARGLIESTLEGRTAFTEAFRLLGLKKLASFDALRRDLGVGY